MIDERILRDATGPTPANRSVRPGPGRPRPRPALLILVVLLVAAVVAITALVLVGATHPGPSGGTASHPAAQGSIGLSASPGTASGGSGGGALASGASGQTAAPPAPASPSVVPPVNASAKVIKTGTVDVAVGRGQVEPAVSRLTALAAGQNGFVAATNTSQGGSAPSGTITLRVPSNTFEDTLNQVRRIGTVRSVTTSGQDVTAQYVDLQARITALQTAQQRYLQILAKAGTIGDILAVQQQIDSLQTQLDQLQGQQRVMDDQTTYAALTVDISEQGNPTPVETPAAAPRGWSLAWHRAVHGFAAAVQGILSASGVLLFLALVLGGLGWLGWRMRRRFRPPAV